MGGQEAQPRYSPPLVSDYGDLLQMTAAAHLPLAQAGVSDLAFSAPGAAPGGGVGDGNRAGAPEVNSGDPSGGDVVVVGGESDSGGSDPGSGGSDPGSGGGGEGSGSGSGGGSGGGDGGKLPFTGFAAGAAAAIGSGLAVAGGALRRAVRRGRD